MKTVLAGHTSEATAYLQEDYPYGRLRCQRRVWVETKPRMGQRMVTQTQNPKNGRWNKPNAGTYSSVIVIFLNSENGHVEHDGLNGYVAEEKIDTFETEFGSGLTDYQRDQIRLLRAMNRASKRVTYTVETVTDDSAPRQSIEEQRQIMKDLTLDELYKDKDS